MENTLQKKKIPFDLPDKLGFRRMDPNLFYSEEN